MYDHYSDPAVSVWQSILAEHEAGRAPAKEGFRQAGLVQSSPVVISDKLAATDRAMRVAAAGKAPKTVVTRQAFQESVGGQVLDCAGRYLRLIRAEAFGDTQEIAEARRDLPVMGACDKGWAESLTEFLKHYALIEHSEVPYRKWANLDDFVLPLPDKAGKATIGVIGDWGTGEHRAQQLLTSLKEHTPDVVIHLGDTYYACTEREAGLLSRHVREVLDGTAVFSLCGNHDMYAGAGPYYRLLDRLGQPASHFCLRNPAWQILAMDTGYNDYNPAKISTGATWVRDGSDEDAGYSELVWHADKLDNAGGRRTILLSHHPLFSRISPIAGQALNGCLHGQFKDRLAQVDLWLWGHEHVQTVYEPFAGLKRGRCIGASAIPNTHLDDIYAEDPALMGQQAPAFLGGDDARLRVDPKSGLYELGYAVVTLDAAAADVSYYAWGEAAGARVMFRDTLEAPDDGAQA